LDGVDLVLAANPKPKSGHHYDDRTGVSYEFPPRYRHAIVPGRRFVYYRGGAGVPVPCYFGSGIVGGLRASQNAGLLVCDILDYRPFASEVPFKDDSRGYLEPGGDRRMFYRSGVRRIAEGAFERIIELGDRSPTTARPVHGGAAGVGGPPGPGGRNRVRHAQYAPSEAARAVEEFAVRRAVDWLAARYVGCAIEQMPRNNPGFDIRVVASSGAVVRYVEVKGTSAGEPTFFISEGERQFSLAEATRFTLVVVWGVNLRTRDCEVSTIDGAVELPNVVLMPRQFQGTLRPGGIAE
jgi:hypothetical protein